MDHDNRPVPARASRFALRCLVLGLALAHVPVAASAQLWPGQTPAVGYVQFQNGATGVVTGYGPNGGSVVEYWSAGEARTQHYDRSGNRTAGFPSNVNAQPANVNRGKLNSYMTRAVPILSGALLTAIGLIVVPDPIADGTACAGYSDLGQTLCSYGFGPCGFQKFEFFLFGPVGTSCIVQHGDVFGPSNGNLVRVVYPVGAYSHRSGDVGFRPIEQYPELEPNRGVVHDYGDVWEGIVERFAPDYVECFNSGSCTMLPEFPPEVQNPLNQELANPKDGDPHPALQPGQTVAPDIYDPYQMPEGVPETTPAVEMNPNGAPNPDDIRGVPRATPRVEPSPGSGPSTEVAGGGAGNVQVDVLVEFPEQMDVFVQNWPQWTPPSIPEGSALPIPDEEDYVLPNASPGQKWLPAQCLTPITVDVSGHSFTIEFDVFCDGAAWIGIFVNLAGALSCALIVLRS